jgi:DNA-directed RNA polymerase subunit omega
VARVTIEDCLLNVENRFALVILASKRVKQLKREPKSYTLGTPKNSVTVQALREIAAGTIRAKREDE